MNRLTALLQSRLVFRAFVITDPPTPSPGRGPEPDCLLRSRDDLGRLIDDQGGASGNIGVARGVLELRGVHGPPVVHIEWERVANITTGWRILTRGWVRAPFTDGPDRDRTLLDARTCTVKGIEDALLAAGWELPWLRAEEKPEGLQATEAAAERLYEAVAPVDDRPATKMYGNQTIIAPPVHSFTRWADPRPTRWHPDPVKPIQWTPERRISDSPRVDLITPHDLDSPDIVLPGEVRQVWNHCIFEFWSSRAGESVVPARYIQDALCAAMGVEPHVPHREGWFNVAGLYRAAGWRVTHREGEGLVFGLR